MPVFFWQLLTWWQITPYQGATDPATALWATALGAGAAVATAWAFRGFLGLVYGDDREDK